MIKIVLIGYSLVNHTKKVIQNNNKHHYLKIYHHLYYLKIQKIRLLRTKIYHKYKIIQLMKKIN